MSSISKHHPKKRTWTVNPHYFCHFCRYIFPRPDLEIFKLFMFLTNVVWGFGFCTDCTGPEIDGEHEFTVKHSTWHGPRKKDTHGNKFRTHKLESWDRFRHFVKYCLFGHQNSSSNTSTGVCCLSHSLFIHSLRIYWLPVMCQSLFGHRAWCRAFMVLVFQETVINKESCYGRSSFCLLYALPASLSYPAVLRQAPLGTWLWFQTRCI